jgi:hypothetical protein
MTIPISTEQSKSLAAELRQQYAEQYKDEQPADVIYNYERERFAAADTIDSLLAEVERLREALREMCDEFEDATYDRIDGTQSGHRKNLIVRCRSELPPHPHSQKEAADE